MLKLWLVAGFLLALNPLRAALPEPPLGVQMTGNSSANITLTWYRQPKDDATGYKIYVSENAEGAFTPVANVSERSFTHSNLKAGATYYYKVAATNPEGESVLSPASIGFTIPTWKPASFPVRVATNMCVSLGSTVVSKPEPTSGELANLTDGSDGTSCTIPGPCEVKIQLNSQAAMQDADYLMLHFRTDSTGNSFPTYDYTKRALRDYVILESSDSTNGEDGTWKEIAKGTNQLIDGVIVLPNHSPKWIAVRNSGDLQLCRLDIFRSAPAGLRNDYWIFTGDSLVVQDMSGGQPERHTVWFSDLVRQAYPDRYPIVLQAARGGEMHAYTQSRMEKTIEALSPPNGTKTPTGTIVCWETGFNDVGLNSSLKSGPRIIKGMEEALKLCTAHGLIMVPVRIEYSTGYLNKETLEPVKYNAFYNTLAVNLCGVDMFARERTPYACDPETQLPYADYWTYTRTNFTSALSEKDGVHHTPEGCDGINRLWSRVAGKMVYSNK